MHGSRVLMELSIPETLEGVNNAATRSRCRHPGLRGRPRSRSAACAIVLHGIDAHDTGRASARPRAPGSDDGRRRVVGFVREPEILNRSQCICAHGRRLHRRRSCACRFDRGAPPKILTMLNMTSLTITLRRPRIDVGAESKSLVERACRAERHVYDVPGWTRASELDFVLMRLYPAYTPIEGGFQVHRDFQVVASANPGSQGVGAPGDSKFRPAS